MVEQARGGPNPAAPRRRARSTRASVLWFDRLARLVIIVGGIGTILAVMTVCFFLFAVVFPLFRGTTVGSVRQVAWQAPAGGQAPPTSAPVRTLTVDEYGTLGWLLTNDGRLRVVDLSSGTVLEDRALIDEGQPRAWSSFATDGQFAVALDDGRVRLGRIGFATRFLEGAELKEAQQALGDRTVAPFREGVVQRTREGDQWRWQRVVSELEPPMTLELDSPPALIDASFSDKETALTVVGESGQLKVAEATRRKNLITGEITTRLKEGTLAIPLVNGLRPAWSLLTGLGDNVLLVWPDGLLTRVDLSQIAKPAVVEEVRLLPAGSQKQVTAVSFLNGKASLAVADSNGGLAVWFSVKSPQAKSPDGTHFVRAHQLSVSGAPLVQLVPSVRSRVLAGRTAKGEVRLFHATSAQELAAISTPATGPESQLALSPRDDAVYLGDTAGVSRWPVQAPHPEITWRSILGKVWYEGYERPEHVWQSSSGTDDFEPKYGLMPLVFGTLKATFYSMMFGAPLAFLAAIYTSEFLNPRMKARVKPTIEIMASLPSVVLGFLAALVVAPLVENAVPQTMLVLVCLPLVYLLGAFLWQLLPPAIATRLRAYRLWAMFAALPISLGLAWQLGGPVERWLFAGDCKAWLDGQVGTGVGAWMILLMPLSGLLVGWLSVVQVTPWMRRLLGDSPAGRFALWDLARFVVSCAVVLGLAYGLSVLFTGLGWDPRGSIIGTYVQRNALVVGLIMGFAIIPIIYTISDDALSAVPESLRAGSLGCGATPWQTAIRVVVPTAMSGLFSAFMVGLGRAVGETMIVLMAAGNTPVMDWNIFSGFRTLSANIATELPEAVPATTHYRMLFLAALCLFTITFLVNTVAEVVRQRFRKRAFQL